MSAKADFSQDDADGGALRFTGDLSLASMGDLPDRLERHEGRVRRVDLSGVDRIDTVGAWVVHRFAARNDAEVSGLSDASRSLFDEVVNADKPVAMRPHQPQVGTAPEAGRRNRP